MRSRWTYLFPLRERTEVIMSRWALCDAGAIGIVAVLTVGCGGQPSAEHAFSESASIASEHQDQKNVRESLNLPQQQTIDLGGGVQLELVLIPAGTFIMGDNTGQADQKPAHKVKVSRPFYLGKHEVTVEQFRRFIVATGYATDAEKGNGFQGAFGWDRETMEFKMNEQYSWQNTGFEQLENHPVVNISWNDAIEFCNWLSSKEAATFRLPTEAEWEYACRAGTSTSYMHGDDAEGVVKVGNVADADFESQFPELEPAVIASDGYAYTSPVGSFSPNAFGLYDMHGNVWEWCADWYDPEYYATSASGDPEGPVTGDERIYRGGGWFNCARGFRSSSRSAGLPDNRHLTLGFRVAAPVN
jgi:formylglycine-generating enzyme required for sulfatase activity